MRKYIDRLNGVIVLLMFLTILVQITFREFLRIPTAWSMETSIILFVFTVFTGIASITRERTHLRVDAFYNICPRWLQRGMDIVCGAGYIVFFIAFAYGCWRNIFDNWDVEIPTIEWCRWGYVYLFVFFATILNILCLAANLFEDVTGRGAKA